MMRFLQRVSFSILFCMTCLLCLGQPLAINYAPLPSNVPLEASLLQATNTARQSEGLNLLIQDEQLALAARHHALEMVRLNYFSHQSPNPATLTAPLRVAQAGSPFVTIGENIAKIPEDIVSSATIPGWLSSPSHRDNLLNPIYTHVGFGTALDNQGFVVVVQVLAYQPIFLERASISVKQQNVFDINLSVSLPYTSEAVFAYGDTSSQPLQLSAGPQSINLESLETGQIHIRGAVKAPTGDGFILQDSGWLNLATGQYQADSIAPKENLIIVSATSSPRSSPVYELDFIFDSLSSRQLAVFINGEYKPNARIQVGTISLQVPTHLDKPIIEIGQVTEGTQVEILMAFMIDTRYGKAQLTPKLK